MATWNSTEGTKVISREYTQYLSGEICKEWKDLGRYLDLSDGKLNQIEADYPHNLKEQIYQMLLFWKQSSGTQATYNILNEALRKAKRCDLTKEVVLEQVLLVGGVMIAANQLVYIFDERRNWGGVLLVCSDPEEPGNEYWRHLEPIDDKQFPVVMSSAGICYDGRQQVMFAVGITLYIIHFQWSGSVSLKVETSSEMSINHEDGSQITSIAPSYVHHQSSDRCSAAVGGSNLIHELRPSDLKVRKRETRGFPSFIISIACTNELLAMVGRGRGDVMLFSTDGKTSTHNLRIPSSGTFTLKPVWVIWNGSKWMVLFVGEGTKIEWQVVSYVENGIFFKVCDKGASCNPMAVPVTITCWGNSGYVIFADNTCRSYKL